MTPQSHALVERKRLEILSGIAILAVLIATLYPFDFFPPNRVSWLTEANGIRFERAGVVVSKGALSPGGTESGNSCSIEILLRPAGVDFFGTIFTFYDRKNPRSFLMQQWGDDLLVSREFVDAENKVKSAKFDVNHFFQRGELVLLTITSALHGTVVYRNGRQVQTFSRFTILQADLSGQIAIGTSAVGYEPWRGEVRGLAIYSRELAPAEVLQSYTGWINQRGGIMTIDGAIARYEFTDAGSRQIRNTVVSGPDLETPRLFQVPHKAFLSSPLRDLKATWGYVFHLLENVLAFVPLGFLFCTYVSRTRSQRRAILYTITAAAIFSFAIEVLQAYIPQKESDITDIIANILGGGLGAVFARPKMVSRILATKKLISENSTLPQN